MAPYEVIIKDTFNYPALRITSNKITIRIPSKIANPNPVIKFLYNVAREIGPVNKPLSGSINSRTNKIMMHDRSLSQSLCFTSNLYIPEIHGEDNDSI